MDDKRSFLISIPFDQPELIAIDVTLMDPWEDFQGFRRWPLHQEREWTSNATITPRTKNALMNTCRPAGSSKLRVTGCLESSFRSLRRALAEPRRGGFGRGIKKVVNVQVVCPGLSVGARLGQAFSAMLRQKPCSNRRCPRRGRIKSLNSRDDQSDGK